MIPYFRECVNFFHDSGNVMLPLPLQLTAAVLQLTCADLQLAGILLTAGLLSLYNYGKDGRQLTRCEPFPKTMSATD